MPSTPQPAVVTLRGFPHALFAASSQQWSDVLRDYLLRGIGGADQPYGADDVARSVRALDVVRLAVEAPGDAAPDVVVRLRDASAGEFAVLQGALDDARRLAIAGETLALPSLPEVVALRDWICEEVMAQAAGGVPTPWTFVSRVDTPIEADLAVWDAAIEPPGTEPWLIGDDHNRIVAASVAASELLGWAPGELIGQRLLAVIPDHLRERHVAGFTRGVVNGEHQLLGAPLALPALHSDGHELPITLTLTRHPARFGRVVFLARMDPEPAAG